MRAVSPSPPCASSGRVNVAARPAWAVRLSDYMELTKPRIMLMVLVTVSVGYALGGAGSWQIGPLVHAMLGIALVAAGSSAVNQYLERATDARMPRTANRPLPAGRLLPGEVLAFGLAAGVLGSLYLAWFVNVPTAVLTALTFILYTAAYTPLKRATSLCTAVGAVPGALPPVLGWTAAGGGLDAGAFALFAILFLWQFPHFLAIAWLYRGQYEQAGLRMLPAFRPAPGVTGMMCTAYALALLPVSLLPAHWALAGAGYQSAALVLGSGYLLCAVRFMLGESAAAARRLLFASLIYLPLLLLALTWNHLQLLQ